MGLTGGIRLTKKWILQEKANEILMKQKISSELKLLKTQIHPRFLFYSLNSLEDKLWKKQTDSPGLILRLADILSYILYESDGEYVLLEKEIEIIREYLEVQKDNFPQTLHTSLDINVPAYKLYIAPLILLSFLEASFENLMMKDDSGKSMHVSIKASEGILFFNLTCSEDRMQEADFSQKPFWSDITKRLESLYPNNHQLLLKSNSKEILIELQLNMIQSDNTRNLPSLVLNSSYDYV
jgi:LytS/YehU family sensor histidine kinase